MEVSEAISARRRPEVRSPADRNSVLMRGEDIVGNFVDLPDEGQKIDVRVVDPGHPSDVPEPCRGLAGFA
jgi:hypothetical protein